MGQPFKTLTTTLLLCCFPAIAQAGPSTYMCKILQAVEMTNAGHIVEHKGFWKGQIGGSFTVNRSTGEMIGLPFGTEGWLGGVQVLNSGEGGNAYRALVLSGRPNVSAKYIYIAEHEDGPSKPFWGSGGDQFIFSGTCS